MTPSLSYLKGPPLFSLSFCLVNFIFWLNSLLKMTIIYEQPLIRSKQNLQRFRDYFKDIVFFVTAQLHRAF